MEFQSLHSAFTYIITFNLHTQSQYYYPHVIDKSEAWLDSYKDTASD